jgi:hypothetical protein
MSNDALIRIRLAGEDIAPGTVRSRDLAEIIISAEDAIASLVVRDNPHLKKDEIVVGLVSIGEGSVSLQFATTLPQLVLPAYWEITESIEKDDYENLPPDSIDSLQNITAFTRRRNCQLEFYARDGDREALAVITPQTLITPIPLMTGSTTIHGMVVRVGGRKPKVMIELPDGQSVFCDIEYELARQLGQRLYTWVGLRGEAKWRSNDLSLQQFRVDEVTQYQDTRLTEAMATLSEAAGRYFEGIEDVQRYVSELRGGSKGD